jgi:leader peptidase (prepilin peptidase)/N-methyltransferase
MLQDVLGNVLVSAAGAATGVAIAGMASHFTRDQTLWPAPICPHCGAALRLSLVPLAGSFLQGGTCPACKAALSRLLPLLIQILVAILYVFFYRQFDLSARLAIACVETAVLVAIALVDAQHRLIPTLLVYPAVVFAVLVSPAWPDLGLVHSLIGTAIGFAMFFALAVIARFAFGEGALGGGDVMLAGLIGAICGYPLLILALAMGALFGGVGAVLAIILKRSAFGTTMPYGPYLVAGVLYIMLSGDLIHPPFSMP